MHGWQHAFLLRWVPTKCALPEIPDVSRCENSGTWNCNLELGISHAPPRPCGRAAAPTAIADRRRCWRPFLPAPCAMSIQGVRVYASAGGDEPWSPSPATSEWAMPAMPAGQCSILRDMRSMGGAAAASWSNMDRVARLANDAHAHRADRGQPSGLSLCLLFLLRLSLRPLRSLLSFVWSICWDVGRVLFETYADKLMLKATRLPRRQVAALTSACASPSTTSAT